MRNATGPNGEMVALLLRAIGLYCSGRDLRRASEEQLALLAEGRIEELAQGTDADVAGQEASVWPELLLRGIAARPADAELLRQLYERGREDR